MTAMGTATSAVRQTTISISGIAPLTVLITEIALGAGLKKRTVTEMYDELVKRLRRYVEIERSEHHGADIEEEAADAIEELSREVDIDNAAMTAMDAAMPRWIPVTEEPPLKVGDDGYNGYLVYANGYYEVADYTTDEFDNVPYFHVNGEWEPDATHYMPLPLPPKEET